MSTLCADFNHDHDAENHNTHHNKNIHHSQSMQHNAPEQQNYPAPPYPTPTGAACYTSNGMAFLPLTDYARELTGATCAGQNARPKIKRPTRVGRPLKRSDSAARSVEVLCSGLCLGIIEMLAGQRTLAQFKHWLSPSCYTALQELKTALLSDGSRPKRTGTPRVIRARAQRVDNASGGYEVALVVHDGVRIRAMAMRVVERYSNWHITTVEYR